MLIFLYESKKQMKDCIGQRLKYQETSVFGAEYRDNGKLTGSNRPSLTGIKGREFFAEVTMTDGVITRVA